MTQEEKIKVIRGAPFKYKTRMHLSSTQWTAELWHRGLRVGLEMEARKTMKYAEALCMLAASVSAEEYMTLPLGGNTVAAYWKDMQAALQALANDAVRGGAI